MSFIDKNDFLETSLEIYRASLKEASKKNDLCTWLINDIINNLTYVLLYNALRDSTCYRDFVPKIEHFAIDCRGDTTVKFDVDGDELTIKARLRYPVRSVPVVNAIITANITVTIEVEPEGEQKVLKAESVVYSLDDIPLEDINNGLATGNYEKWLLI
jgi:hypothetical protein